jgi:hypothetical protein
MGLKADTLPLCHDFLMNISYQTGDISFFFSGNLALCVAINNLRVAEWRIINANTMIIGFVFGHEWLV